MFQPCSLFILFCSVYVAQSEALTGEQKVKLQRFVDTQNQLLQKLTTNYRRDIPPLYTKARYDGNETIPMELNITATYVKLLSLNEPEQTLSVTCETILDWYDFRLEWDPTDFDGIQMISALRSQFWMPDMMPVDIVSFLATRLPEADTVLVYYNGTVSYHTSYVFTMFCPLDVSNFPFDTQKCAARMMTGNFDIRELTVRSKVLEDIANDGMSNGEWVSGNIESYQSEINVPYKDWPVTVVYYNFTIRRSPTYYVVMIIIPSFILTYLSIWGLFWSEVSEETQSEKLGLGFSSVLALVLNMQTATDTIPKISEVPLLSACILANLFLVTASLIAITITARYIHCEETIKEKKKSEGSRRSAILSWAKRHIHRAYLVIFSLAATINLIVLWSKK